MSCDEVARVLAFETLIEEVGGEAALREHGATCTTCRGAIDAFLDDEALLCARFVKAPRILRSPRRTFAPAGIAAIAASLLVALFVFHDSRARVVARGDAVGELREGKTITTRSGSTEPLRLADGSDLEVGSDSSVRLGPGRAFGVSAFLIYGRVRCKVRPGDGPFRVATPRGEVVAGATEFDVTYAPARADSAPAETHGVSVMTWSGGFPKAALLTVAVAVGAVEFHDLHAAGAAGLVAVAAQEMLVATGDEAPRIVRMTGGESPIEVPAHDADHVYHIARMVSALKLAPDGRHVAICVRRMGGGEIGDGGPRFVGVNLWNVERDRFDGFVGLDGSPSDAAYTADGRLWATEAMNNEMRRVDFAAHGVVETLDLNVPPNLLTSDDARIYPSPDGRHVVVTGFNTSKTLYAYPGWNREAVLEGPTDCLPCEGAWSSDSKSFVAATLENVIKVWPIRAAGGARPRSAGTGVAPLFGPNQKVFALTPDLKAFGPSEAEGDQRRLFVCGSGQLVQARFSPDGQRVALGTTDGRVFIHEVASGKRLHVVEYTPPPDSNGSAGCLLWGADGSWLAIGRDDGSSCIARFDVK